MMDCTDRHYRSFMRKMTKRTLLYTEMVTANAILYGDRDHLLGFSPEEHPISLQLGGHVPKDMAECARIAQDMGYDEVNINVGCPSSRVQSGQFGACLMAEPETVAACVEAMRQAVAIPVTVKTRLGIDHADQYQDLVRFVSVVAQTGADRFTIHARKAWLQGLSPKQNRTIPPLLYDRVYRLKAQAPHLCIEINGGITTLEACKDHLEQVDGVMLGRAAYSNPYLFAAVDRMFYDDQTVQDSPTRDAIAISMRDYVEEWTRKGLKPARIFRHMLNLYAGEPGARAWKQTLTKPERAFPSAVTQLDQAVQAVQDVRADVAHRERLWAMRPPLSAS